MNILGTGFEYYAELVDSAGRVQWVERVHNLIPQEGVDYFGRVIAGTTPVIQDWFVGVFEADYTPSSSSGAAELATTVGESTAYEAVTRPPWAGSYDSSERVTNAASKAEFVFTENKVIHGAFLVSTGTKHDVSGTLLSIARFSSPRDIEAGSTLKVLAGIRLISNV